MRHFVRHSIKDCRCGSFNDVYKLTISDEVFNIISKEINVINCIICEISDKNFEQIKKHRKIMEDDYDSQFDDYRDITQEERTNCINKKTYRTTNKKVFTKKKS